MGHAIGSASPFRFLVNSLKSPHQCSPFDQRVRLWWVMPLRSTTEDTFGLDSTNGRRIGTRSILGPGGCGQTPAPHECSFCAFRKSGFMDTRMARKAVLLFSKLPRLQILRHQKATGRLQVALVKVESSHSQRVLNGGRRRW